jgi:hypothetical protein
MFFIELSTLNAENIFFSIYIHTYIHAYMRMYAGVITLLHINVVEHSAFGLRQITQTSALIIVRAGSEVGIT